MRRIAAGVVLGLVVSAWPAGAQADEPVLCEHRGIASDGGDGTLGYEVSVSPGGVVSHLWPALVIVNSIRPLGNTLPVAVPERPPAETECGTSPALTDCADTTVRARPPVAGAEWQGYWETDTNGCAMSSSVWFVLTTLGDVIFGP